MSEAMNTQGYYFLVTVSYQDQVGRPATHASRQHEHIFLNEAPAGRYYAFLLAELKQRETEHYGELRVVNATLCHYVPKKFGVLANTDTISVQLCRLGTDDHLWPEPKAMVGNATDFNAGENGNIL